MFERLCKALNAGEIEKNPNYATGELRKDNRDKLNSEIAAYTRHKSSAELIEVLNENGVPCGPIYTIDKMFDDPQVKHLGLSAPVSSASHGEINLVSQAINMSRAPRSIRSATPKLGEHTDAILLELGYAAVEIEKLYADTVV